MLSESISKENIIQSEKITYDIDPDDSPFIAFYLQYRHKILSGDKELIKELTKKGYRHIFITMDDLKSKIYKKKNRN